MKHVNAYPFVGKDYEKGFLNSGKKVLILGHSHYDADSAGCPCHHSFTIDYDGRILEWRRWSFL